MGTEVLYSPSNLYAIKIDEQLIFTVCFCTKTRLQINSATASKIGSEVAKAMNCREA